MLWQWLAVAAIVAAAVLYLGRRAWRTWNKRGCGGGCGCTSSAANGKQPNKTTLIPADELQVRRRG